MPEKEYEFAEPPVYVLRDPDGGLFVPPNEALPFTSYHFQIASIVKEQRETLGEDWQVYRALDDEELPVPWSKDITAELVYNKGPYSNDSLTKLGGWWQRELSEIDGATIHHTLSDSPHATARYCANTKKLPSIQYTIWITQTGEILQCAPLEWGLYHDATGLYNTHLSIGMAGRLHEYKPASVQIDAAVKVCRWAVLTLPGVTGML
jgi:hypothetical protein